MRMSKAEVHEMRVINAPFGFESINNLRAGEQVLLSGDIYTGRDAAHKRMIELLDKKMPLPFDIQGQAIYYCGPCPAPPGRVIGSAGPTTSLRMDAYAPRLMQEGLRVMIGKGERSQAVIDSIVQYTGVYLAAAGGAGAFLSLCVKHAELIAFEDLGTEAIYKLTVRDMPLVVAIDCAGGNIYKVGKFKDYASESLKLHEQWRGKIEVVSRVPVNSREDLSLAYTPGVAEPCLAIQKDINKSYTLTRRSDMVAVITDGTAVLGLGDIGPEAAMPVMEGKAVLFKELGGVDAFPLCIRSRDVDEIVNTVRLLAGNFGGINLEDISAPRCFEIERRLKACCDIPIFHDDQHGTAIVTLAAVLNALRITGKKLSDVSVVINGAGAAGIAVAKLLLDSGTEDIILCDRQGAIYKGQNDLNAEKTQIAEITNPERRKGTLADVMRGADIFIGVSAPGCVTRAMVKSMNSEPVVFPMSNPIPEIMPDEAKAGGAVIVGTGRSDFPNQINNALAFPGVLRGALDAYASEINEVMKIAAAKAIAEYVTDKEISVNNIVPSPLDKKVAASVAAAVARAAEESGVARNIGGFDYAK